MSKKITVKDAYYFSHDSNARNDPKIVRLRKDKGWEAYGLFWAIIEKLREEKDYQLPVIHIPLLAYEFMVPDEIMNDIIMNYDLFVITEDQYFYSDRLVRSMNLMNQKRQKQSEAGTKGNAIRWANQSPPDPDPIASKGNETKENESKGEGSNETDSPAHFFNISDGKLLELSECMNHALADIEWVKSNDTYAKELEVFNDKLRRESKKQKTLYDYKAHFASWKSKNPAELKDLPIKTLKLHETRPQDNW